MKVGAVVGVKDEAELIAPCIERLRAIGVDGIVVLDDRSSDGTTEIVADMIAATPGTLHRVEFVPVLQDNLHRDGPALSTLIGHHAPDWILFTDADEFWLPATDSLHDVLRRVREDALVVDRFNVPLVDPAFAPMISATADYYKGAPVISKREQMTASMLRSSDSKRWVMNAIMPKMVCRADRLLAFDAGAHTARSIDGTAITMTTPADLIILHIPLTSFVRFEQKAENARQFFERWLDDYPGESAWHWKRWVELAAVGQLESEFERQRMDTSELRELRSTGVVMTASELLAVRTQ
jgi:glycosyltransferase involved in cell wall biosynthesis